MKTIIHLFTAIAISFLFTSCNGSSDSRLEKELDGEWVTCDETRSDEGFEMTFHSIYIFNHDDGEDILEHPFTQQLRGGLKIKEGRDTLLIDFTASVDGTYYVENRQLGIYYDHKTVNCDLSCGNPKFKRLSRDLKSTFRTTLLEMIQSNTGNIHFPSFTINGDTLSATDFQGSPVTLTRKVS